MNIMKRLPFSLPHIKPLFNSLMPARTFSQTLTHVHPESGVARMVDITDKTPSSRSAIASAEVLLSSEAFQQVQTNTLKKGDVLSVSRIAGIQAAKKTSDLIPLCHALPLSSIQIDFTQDSQKNKIHILCTAKTTFSTGVEMEALTGATVAALTIYDMVKAVDKGVSISNVHLQEKTGGKSGAYYGEEKKEKRKEKDDWERRGGVLYE